MGNKARIRELERRVAALERERPEPRQCRFCGAPEFLTNIPHGSKYEGEYVCGECLDAAFAAREREQARMATLDSGATLAFDGGTAGPTEVIRAYPPPSSSSDPPFFRE